MFGDGGENTWYTPMFFAPAWEMRRTTTVIQRMSGGQEEPMQEPQQAKETEPMIIEVSGNKGRRNPEGQLMFVF